MDGSMSDAGWCQIRCRFFVTQSSCAISHITEKKWCILH